MKIQSKLNELCNLSNKHKRRVKFFTTLLVITAITIPLLPMPELQWLALHINIIANLFWIWVE